MVKTTIFALAVVAVVGTRDYVAPLFSELVDMRAGRGMLHMNVR
jgi:hypothetical protein